jgi:hypothetical protein
MKRAGVVAVALSSAFIAGSHVRAQDGNEMITRMTAVIERKLQSQEALRLSADTITLTGAMLHLSGHAEIVSKDTKVQANEIVFDQTTKRIALIGVTRGFLGAGSDVVDGPRIEFR